MKLGNLQTIASRLTEIDSQLAAEVKAVLGFVLDDILLRGIQAEAVSIGKVEPLLVDTPRGCRIWIGFTLDKELKVLSLNPQIRPLIHSEENSHEKSFCS